MTDTTIVYYTDNQLDEFLFRKCQEFLIEAADGKRIISVSQKPIDFGDNICLGDIGRSHISLFSQMLAGAEAADTEYVALAEHDCIYSKEHFNWIPPSDDIFYYNVNLWLVQYGGHASGMYSYMRRRVLSGLICNRELLIEAAREKLAWLKIGAQIRKGLTGACEPGVRSNQEAFVINNPAITKDLGKGEAGKAEMFRTTIPNLDIRHGGNFSGGRRAKKRRYYLEPWGNFQELLGIAKETDGPPPGEWYQEATINGVKMPQRRQRDTSEKRWQTFVKPLIKPGPGAVTDLGCNAGFYCRKMVDLGYSATGVERSHEFLAHARYWEKCEPKGVRVVESDIAEHKLRCSHYLLMANVHYWLTSEQLHALKKQMDSRVLNVILIGRHHQHYTHNSPCDFGYLSELFKGWDEVKYIAPHGNKHFSVLFRNPKLTARNIDDLFQNQQLFKSKKFLPAYNKLIDEVLAGKQIEPEKTEYMEYLRWRGFDDCESLFEKHVNVITTMAEERTTQEPLTIDGGRVIDGDHRLIVAKKLGIKSLLFVEMPIDKFRAINKKTRMHSYV